MSSSDVARDVAAVTARAHAAGEGSESTFESLMALARSPRVEPQRMDEFVAKLAANAQIDVASIQTDAETGVVSGRLTFDGLPIAGRFEIAGRDLLVEVSDARGEMLEAGFVARQLTIRARGDGQTADSGRTSVQMHPDTSKPASTLIARDHPAQVVGWEMRVDGKRTVLSPTLAAPTEDGRGWRIGNLAGGKQDEVLEGAIARGSYDAWMSQLAAYR